MRLCMTRMLQSSLSACVSPAFERVGRRLMGDTDTGGVGKTTLGLIAATCLRRPFIDVDSLFQSMYKTTIATYVRQYGWQSFREAESRILQRLLADNDKNVVIATGGGVVERKENRDLLASFRDLGHPVIHVVRDHAETTALLSKQSVQCVLYTLSLQHTHRLILVCAAHRGDIGARKSRRSGDGEHRGTRRWRRTRSRPSPRRRRLCRLISCSSTSRRRYCGSCAASLRSQTFMCPCCRQVELRRRRRRPRSLPRSRLLLALIRHHQQQ